MQSHSDHFQDLIENSVHMIMQISPQGLICYVNPAWQQILGYDGSKASTLKVVDLVHPDYRTDYDKLFQHVLTGQALDHFETVLQKQDGQWVTVAGSMSCRIVQGHPSDVQAMFQNISDRKRAEDMLVRQATELLRMHTTLEARDRELADTLEEARKYREAEARAEELTKVNRELTQEVNRRQEAEAVIRASLAEKEVLLKEIHHRVKNNLQIVSSLLNLQSGYVDDKRTLQIFKESQSRIQSMALAHEKLYQSEDLARVNFAEYIEGLVNYLTRSYGSGGVRVDMDVAPVFLSLDTSIPCGLIVSELVSNAFKYAFPQGQSGRISVCLQPIGDTKYELVVGDTGVGFPKDIDFQNTESLGLQLVTTLASQLDGEIELSTKNGTEFRIHFEVHKSDRTHTQSDT